MTIIDNPELYEKVKEYANTIYKKPSAYKSGFIVKKYKELGGTYSGESTDKPLQRWFRETWTDVSNMNYPVYRPTIRINKNTPLTVDEIDDKNLKKQVLLKQIIKGNSNLPKFEAKKYDITAYSYKKAKELGVIIKPSSNPKKKIDVYDENNKFITSIGNIKYFDYPHYLLKDKNVAEDRRRLYKIRHRKDRSKIGSAGYYSDNILW